MPMDTHVLVLFAVTTGIAMISPGPDMLFILGCGRRAYARGLLTNLLNPKMVTFTIAFLPQFIEPRLSEVWLQFAVLGVILIALEFVVDGAVGVFAGQIGAWLRRRQSARRRLDAATGGLFIGLGVR